MGTGRWKMLSSALVTGFALVASAAAIDFEKLVMPGPVIRGHADLEWDCDNCHQALDAVSETTLCLDCHIK